MSPRPGLAASRGGEVVEWRPAAAGRGGGGGSRGGRGGRGRGAREAAEPGAAEPGARSPEPGAAEPGARSPEPRSPEPRGQGAWEPRKIAHSTRRAGSAAGFFPESEHYRAAFGPRSTRPVDSSRKPSNILFEDERRGSLARFFSLRGRSCGGRWRPRPVSEGGAGAGGPGAGGREGGEPRGQGAWEPSKIAHPTRRAGSAAGFFPESEHYRAAFGPRSTRPVDSSRKPSNILLEDERRGSLARFFSLRGRSCVGRWRPRRWAQAGRRWRGGAGGAPGSLSGPGRPSGRASSGAG
jgi:hypothetical protein